MENYIKGFTQFVNEMAKGDYFRTKGEFDPETGKTVSRFPDRGDVYGLHKGGMYDRMIPGSKNWKELVDSEPDEELTTAEFIDRHGEEIDPAGRDWLSQLSPDKKMQVWRNRAMPEKTPQSATPRSNRIALDTMTTAELKRAKSIINKILKDEDLTPQRTAQFKEMLKAFDKRLKKSKD